MSVKITCDVAENMSCWKRRLCGQIVETKKSGEERSGGVEWRGVITVGVTVSCPYREDAHSTDRRTLQMLRGLTVPPMVTFPDTYSGKLVALH